MRRKKALIIIDMQKGFVNEHTAELPKKIAEYTKKNKDKFDAVIATKYVNHKNTACYVFEHWDACMEGSEDVNLVPEINDLWSICYEKDVYSCWCRDLKNTLQEKGITDVVLCGVNTGCCVLHSAFDMYNALVSCYVVEDLCGSTSGPSSHSAAIQILKECITSERVIDSLTDIDTL